MENKSPKAKIFERVLLISLLLIAVLILVALLLNLHKGGVWILQGLNGANGTDGKDGINGPAGADGKSAYELALEDGFSGSMHEWLVSMAIPGERGKDGVDGKDGKDGLGIRDVYVDAEGNLILMMTDGTKRNVGYVGNQGFVSGEMDEAGFSEVYEIVIMNDEASHLNLRSQPDTDSESLAVISAGSELLRIGHNKTTGWTRLIYNGTFCYAKEKYFDLKYIYGGDLPELHLPSSISLTVGEQTWFMTDAILADQSQSFSLSFSYSGSGERVYEEHKAFAITPTVAEEATLTLRLETRDGGEWRVLEEYSVAVTVNEAKKDLSLTGLVIGDSRISDGSIVTKLQNDMQNLTLIGTRKTANYGISHEGRGAWSTANYLKSPSVTLPGSDPVANAFYNPVTQSFDFSYYMQQNYPSSSLDFVVINLGANDGFTQGSVENLIQMTDSIRAYAAAQNREIAILVMTEYLSPSAGYCLSQASNIDVAAMRGKQFRYFTYLQKAFAERTDEGIYLLPNYLCINDWSDRYRSNAETSNGTREMITDVVHLGWSGYQKEAAMIEAYLFDIFG